MTETLTCDQCKATVSRGQARHWFQLSRIDDVLGPQHFCSWDCLALRGKMAIKSIKDSNRLLVKRQH